MTVADRFSVEAVFRAVDNITAPLRGIRRSLGMFQAAANRNLASVKKSFNELSTSARNAAAVGVATFTAAAATATAGTLSLVKAASKIEDAEAAFTPLLGGADRAREMVNQLNIAAAETPFQFENLSDVTKQLLPVMKGDIAGTIDTLKMLGDTAGGNAQKLDTITRGYTKAMLKGKTDMESLSMIAEAGVPIFNELAESMGIEMGEDFFDMISGGEVTVDQLNAAFKRMTSQGGIFFEGMIIASRTQSGLWSTLMDNIDTTQALIGAKLLPHTKALTGRAIELTQKIQNWVTANSALIDQKLEIFVKRVVDNLDAFKDTGLAVLQILGGLIAMWVLLKLITIATNVVMLVFNFTMLLVRGTVFALNAALWALQLGMTILRGVLAGARIAVLLFNLALIANPIGLIVTLIAGLVAAAVALIVGWEPVTEFFSGLWEKIKTYTKQGVDFLIGVLNIALAPMKLLISGAGRLFKAFGGGGGSASGDAPPTVTSGDITASALGGSNSYAEVTLVDQTGRAEVTNGRLGDNIRLVDSGGL